ncbi:1-phosphofructokinase family hexose kinase [Rhizorhapis sp. SPR117]|uniref:1-phosphofructokinase family hexose kinase n=1 Tax=Rhizorhapis sp. SPR117 TaxID=2912611 RepID=UPI001F1B07B5|nr:1-phosphofructokinase family hexose kinase [Rhizorhapis sp. SPR117]
MKSIATLTMNPTIDVSYEVDGVFHTHKMRTRNERYAPGGGGINVARVFCRLGGTARCYYLSGGATSAALDGLVDLHQLVRTRIPIEHDTRIATAVLERESGKEYRFTPPGPPVAAEEWQDCLDRLAEVDCSYLVASGSLPPGVPADFYARVIKIMRERGIRTVLDTSGEALKEGLEGGGFLLVKPSLGELRQLVGRELESIEEIGEAAKAIVGKGQSELVAVTMGYRGALLAWQEGALHLPALPIEAKSAVGAGDSFLAGMVHALTVGHEPVDAFRYGMAAGSAAVLTPGTDLAFPEDIDRLFALVAKGGKPLSLRP